MIKWSVKEGSAHLQHDPVLNMNSLSVLGHVNDFADAGLIVFLLI